MGFVDASIEVDVATPVAYSAWLDYESYPAFMPGVDEVAVVGYCRLRWTGRVCDRVDRWEADVVEHVEDTRLRWHARDGRETAEVSFDKLDAGQTLIRYQLEYRAEAWGAAEDALRACLQRRVTASLERFKELAESQDEIPR